MDHFPVRRAVTAKGPGSDRRFPPNLDWPWDWPGWVQEVGGRDVGACDKLRAAVGKASYPDHGPWP